MPSITTLKDLLPLVADIPTCREFCWVILQNVSACHKHRLAQQARDELGRTWTDGGLRTWLAPKRHSPTTIDAQRKSNRVAFRKYLEIPENRAKHSARSERVRKTSLQRQVAMRLRVRVNNALKGKSTGKVAKTMELIGCTVPELMAHLKTQFTEGMTWDNQGDWHIDHIRPCASFDLTNPAQQRQCFHWTNLQPLWASDNLAKADH
ncbi:MAG: hypothetical protein QM644_21680 [Mobilitalea sp.]